MKKIKLLIWVVAGLVTTSTFSQKTQDEIFNQEVKLIKDKIVEITNKEKDLLKESIDSINTLLENGTISFEKSNELKEEIAQKRAKNIEEKVNAQNEKLSELVKSKVQGDLKETDNGVMLIISNKGFEFVENGEPVISKKARTIFNVTIATGYNTLITDGDLPYYASKNFSAHFFEWGGTLRTRLKKDSDLLALRYGLSMMYNYAAPKDNYYFVVNGNQTDVMESAVKFSKNKFRNVYLTLPVHLEFNIGKANEYRIGLGGFAGYNTSSEQRLKFRENGRKIKDMTRKDWNVNDWNYGLSAYAGYGPLSIYAKYDLNPVFRNNTVEQYNLSIGIRLDL